MKSGNSLLIRINKNISVMFTQISNVNSSEGIFNEDLKPENKNNVVKIH